MVRRNCEFFSWEWRKSHSRPIADIIHTKAIITRFWWEFLYPSHMAVCILGARAAKSLANDLWIFHKVDSCKLNTRIQGKQVMCYLQEQLSGRLEFQLCSLQCLANTGSCSWAHLSLSNRPVCSGSMLGANVPEYSLPHYYLNVVLPYLPVCSVTVSLYPVLYHYVLNTSTCDPNPGPTSFILPSFPASLLVSCL